MKFAHAFLVFFGSAGAISTLAEFEDGVYSVSAAGGFPDFSSATPLDNTTFPSLPGVPLPAGEDPDENDDDDDEHPLGNGCARELKQPVRYEPRGLGVPEADYASARRRFEGWISAAEGRARLGPGQCKYAKSGFAAVGACNYAYGWNPVCSNELAEAMRGADLELDLGGCGGPGTGCAVKIKKWRKYYCRFNLREPPREIKSSKC